MKRLAIALVLMTVTEAYADWDDDPFVPIPLIPEERSEGVFEKMEREQRQRFREMNEDFARQDQENTNYQIREYIDEQRERQKELDRDRELKELGTYWN
jgi:hypothetical protein